MRNITKTLPFWANVEAVLAATSSTTKTVTADSKERLIIERITADVRTTASYAVADHLNMVELQSKVNGSYTRGEAPLYAIAGKASVSIPVFLPEEITIEPGASLDAIIRNVSATAETVQLTFIGRREVV